MGTQKTIEINKMNSESSESKESSEKKSVYSKHTGYLHADLMKVVEKDIKPVDNRKSNEVPGFQDSLDLLSPTKENAIENLLALVDNKDIDTIKDKVENANSSARDVLMDMALLIDKLSKVEEYKDQSKQFGEKLIALIQRDTLDKHSGFFAWNDGNCYYEVKKLEGEINKACNKAFPEGVFESTVKEQVIPFLKKYVEQEYGPQPLSTWERFAQSKGLISACGAMAGQRMVDEVSKHQKDKAIGLSATASSCIIALLWTEMQRSTQKAPVDNDARRSPEPPTVQKPGSGLGHSAVPESAPGGFVFEPRILIMPEFNNTYPKGPQSDSHSQESKAEVKSSLAHGMSTSDPDRNKKTVSTNTLTNFTNDGDGDNRREIALREFFNGRGGEQAMVFSNSHSQNIKPVDAQFFKINRPFMVLTETQPVTHSAESYHSYLGGTTATVTSLQADDLHHSTETPYIPSPDYSDAEDEFDNVQTTPPARPELQVKSPIHRRDSFDASIVTNGQQHSMPEPLSVPEYASGDDSKRTRLKSPSTAVPIRKQNENPESEVPLIRRGGIPLSTSSGNVRNNIIIDGTLLRSSQKPPAVDSTSDTSPEVLLQWDSSKHVRHYDVKLPLRLSTTEWPLQVGPQQY